MDTPDSHPDPEAALQFMRDRFYGGDLPAAVRAGQAFLDTIEPAACRPDEHTLRARALLWLVRCARRSDELDVALAHTYTGVAAARAGGNRRLECQLWAQQVHVLASLGQNEAASSEGFKALRCAGESADTLAQASCWLAMGQVHWTMQQWEAGENAYAEALALARRCGDKELCGLASNGIAAMQDHFATEARRAGRADDALGHALRSFALLAAFTGNSRDIGDAYNAWIGTYNQASCLFGMGKNDAARELLNAQLALLDGESGSRRQLILNVLGDIHLAEGRLDTAIACQREALEIAERLQVPMLAMDACGALVNALERRGDHQEALVQHRRYHGFYVQLASNKAQAHARAMAVMYETEKTLALAETLRQRADGLALANSSLILEKAVLQRHSMEDALTGLPNRRRFDKSLQASPVRGVVPADRAIAMIDVDHFKRVNDRFSHLVGDEVLRRLGALFQRHCRKEDLAARYGGEEFALILTDVDRAAALLACERLRWAVEAEPWSVVHPQLSVTVSIGVVHSEEGSVAIGLPELLSIADTRLYAAKRSGRNRVVGAEAGHA